MKIVDINRYFKNNPEFISRVEALGFTKGPGTVWFYRRRDSYIDVFAFWVSGLGNFLDVPVVCYKADLVYHCDMSVFPKGFAAAMPILSETSISKSKKRVDRSESPWRIGTEEELRVTLDELVVVIESDANKWFLDIDTDRKFFESLPPYRQVNDHGLSIKSKLNLD